MTGVANRIQSSNCCRVKNGRRVQYLKKHQWLICFTNANRQKTCTTDKWLTICDSDVLFMLLYCFAIPAKKILFFQWESRYVGILQNKNMINAQIDLLIRQKKLCWVYKFCLFSQNISAPKNSLVLTFGITRPRFSYNSNSLFSERVMEILK